MAAPIAFESAWVKKEERKQIREARQDYLDKAKEKYEREEQRREAARQRGENTWMLDSVSQRIQQQQQVSDKAKSKKHKKEKKRKKLKKEKKKGKRTKSSDSESETEEEAVWVEQGAQGKTEKSSTKGPQLQRDSWMESPLDLIPTVTRDDLRRSRKEQEQQEKPAVSLIDQPGQHPRELNPFWKDGGTGLPEDRSAASSSKGGNSRAGDRGVSWLRKAYQRCQQQAAEEKRPLAEVAEERWGSLEKLENMLAESERKGEEQHRGRGRTDWRDQTQGRSRFMRPRSRSRDSERSNRRDRDRSPSRERNRSRSKERHRHRRRSGSTERSQPRSRSKDRHSRSPDQRSKRGRFLKPRESGEKSSDHRADRRPDTRPSWRKEGFEKPSEKSPRDSPSLEGKPPAKGKPHDTRGGDSTSDSSSDSSVSEDEAPPQGETASPTEPLLTEQQLNELGAKILRAEIMGDEELASSLKHKLSVAQKALEDRKKNPVPINPEGEENVVVLTRVDKRGMVRPLPDRKHPVEPKGGRRKAGKAQTHSDEGRRQKYFDDDDKFDLKTLVEREKMGTAEDQNGMFARLAGRAAEKTDDDFQVDDLFIKNAMRKQNESRLEDRDRMLAITDHKKMTAALDKCQFCFDKVPKHLIIAIGTKSYLCLPNHRSLTEGHCQIVPMQHVSCATALDEDVWSEIQTFRKSLTRMFASNEEDCVFMESAMFLRSQPHMLVECVPLPRELGDMAPIYFKKAILDSETEWAQNKKVVDLSQKDVRRAVPKGFPYFSVDFGLQGGFAHVIEDEKKFTTYFGKEVLGGMLDAEPRLWRKPWRENFEDQRKKVLQFADVWKPFDWTQNLDK